MLFAETIIQLNGGELVGGLIAAGTAVGGGIAGAAKIITSVITKLHTENRADRAELLGVVKSQWEHLGRLAQNTRVTAQAVRSVQKKVGAKPVPVDDECDDQNDTEKSNG